MSSTSSYNLASKKVLELATKLEHLAGNFPVQQVIAETTMLTQEAIVDKITTDVRAHSAMSRKVPKELATDLVDTGAYRASWKVSFPDPFTGRVSTSISYAAPLEYGAEHMPGFFVARDTARKQRQVFIKKFQDAIKKAMQ